jgi:hypothetical protein
LLQRPDPREDKVKTTMGELANTSTVNFKKHGPMDASISLPSAFNAQAIIDSSVLQTCKNFFEKFSFLRRRKNSLPKP